jgi:hypothetical protein
MSEGRQARILLLGDDRAGLANTVLDHIAAFRRFSRHQVRTFNTRAIKRSVALDLDDFDAVVIHYSMVLTSPQYFSPALLEQLRSYRGLKVQFIQDDYRWVDRTTAAARDVGIDVLFTVAPEPAASQLYDERLPGVRRVQTLTGYVPDNLLHVKPRPLRERTIDVGYRARETRLWLGRLSHEKAFIGHEFSKLAPAYGLRCDISTLEHDRIYGARWVEFMSSCRATLGTESGASIADFDGRVEREARAYLAEHPGAEFDEIAEAVLRPYEGNVVVNVISPRVFEAAALGTALIMFPGEYSGVIQADRNYIPLEKDFSNMAEVVARLSDEAALEEMIVRTRADVIESGRWSFQSFVEEFDRVIDEEVKVKRGPSLAVRWRMARWERALKVPGPRVRFFRAANRVWTRLSRKDQSVVIHYDSQIEKGWLALRLLVTDRNLRALFRSGRRVGAPLDRLLREILELWLLQRAAASRESFRLNTEFDAEKRSLTYVSVPPGQDVVDDDASRMAVRAAVRKGELQTIEWDHRSLGGKVQLDDSATEVGIGFGGLENFTLLARIGRHDPSALERALEPTLTIARPDRRTNSVG